MTKQYVILKPKKNNTQSTSTDASKVEQIPALELKTTASQREAPALQNTLINDYAEVFQKNIQTTNFMYDINHHIITSGPPVKSNLRRLSPEKLTFVKEEIAQLLQDGIITPIFVSACQSNTHCSKISTGKVSNGWRLQGTKHYNAT